MACRRIRLFFYLILVLAAVNAGADRCNDVPEVFATMPTQIVEILNENGMRSVIRARMAVSPRQRAAGFQHVCEAEIARFPLLFVFDRDVRTLFHMQNVQVPLYISFFSRSGRFISGLAKYVLKIPANYMASSHLIAMRWSSVAMNFSSYLVGLESFALFFGAECLRGGSWE